MATPFAVLPPRPTAVEACTRSLRESILSGAVAVGSRLPPERELAASLGVNRLTLRSALGQLVAAGLVSVRQGSGYVVRDFSETGGPDLVAPFLEVASDPARRREAIGDLLFVRRALARGVLERLISRIDAAGIRRIKAAVEAFAAVAEAQDATPAKIAVADHATIRAIVREAGSTILMLATNPVLAVADAIPELSHEIFAEPSVNVAGYRLLAAALEAKDPHAVDEVLAVMTAADEALVAQIGGGAKPGKKTSTTKRKK
ncbi:MAG TPA: GntR family transcriptional regulator [bacterium]|nr:GntR family transcriptional regulator [bacterium]